MEDSEIIRYLDSFVNKTEDISGLLRIFIRLTESKSGAIFIYQEIKRTLLY